MVNFTSSQFFIGLISIILLFSQHVIAQEVIDAKNPSQTRITFGSCNKFYRNHKSVIFSNIADKDPDTFIWLGDIAYVDNMHVLGLWWPQTNFTLAAEKYAISLNDPDYLKLKSKTNQIIAIWDDHDYNHNNGGKEFVHQYIMQKIFLDAIGEPSNSPRRTQEGIYASYYVGNDKRVQVILVDGRFHRDPVDGDPETIDVLGPEQWKWLIRELNDTKPYIFFLGSGTQFLPDDRPKAETWYQYSKNKLYSVLRELKKSVIILSGDIHIGEFLTHPCGKQYLGYELYQITSSGLSFGFNQVPYLFNISIDLSFPDTYSNPEIRYQKENFGLVDILWNEQDIMKSKISMNVFGQINPGVPVINKQITLADITYSQQTFMEHQNSQCIIETISPQKRHFQYFTNRVLLKISQGSLPVIIAITLILLIFLGVFKVLKLIFSVFYDGQPKIESTKKLKQN